MKVNSKVFRAYDVRGVVGKELSDELIEKLGKAIGTKLKRNCLLYTSPSPRDRTRSRMPSSA